MNSLTTVTAVINIDAAAAVGSRTVTLTTGTEIASLSGGFAVTLAVNQPPAVNAGSNRTFSLSSTTVQFTEFPTPTPNSGPYSIRVGPDGNLWFTEGYANKIGTVTAAGKITEFPVPTNPSPNGGSLIGIAAGPDGNLWFTEYFGNTIWKMTPAGILTPFAIPTAGSSPYGITAGPDGNLWFTERIGNKIGRITPTGVFAEFPIPSLNSQPFDITPGPDGNLWFAESGNINGSFVGESKIGRITPSGVITEFPVPTVHSAPIGITAGPDGNLWFTEAAAAVSQIGRITPAGVITEYPTPTMGSNPLEITSGPDGNLWFAEGDGNQVGKITTAGAITEYPVPATASSPLGIAAGPDGNLWFTEQTGNQIGRANFGVFPNPTSVTLTGSVKDDGLPIGATESTTWSMSTGPASVSFGNSTMTFPDVAAQSNPVTTSTTFSAPGTYTLNLTGSDSQLSS